MYIPSGYTMPVTAYTKPDDREKEDEKDVVVERTERRVQEKWK